MAAIVLTRPIAQSMRFGDAISEHFRGVDITTSPLLQIQPLEFGPTPPELDVIFTSENGVAGFLEGAEVGKRKAFCVGDRTAEAAREAGFDAHSASGTSVDLIDLIAAEGAGEMIYARGEHVARDLSAELAAIGIPVREYRVYSQEPVDLTPHAHALVNGADRVIFPLFSARSMRLLVEQEIAGGAAALMAVCLSQTVAQSAPSGYFDDVAVCDAPNSVSMIAKMRTLIT